MLDWHILRFRVAERNTEGANNVVPPWLGTVQSPKPTIISAGRRDA
jgi:hypothetical protein